MSARIPHLLTRLLTESECDSLRAEMTARATVCAGPARRAWSAAARLLEQHRDASLQRRSRQTPSARRKSLGYRPATSI